MEPHNSDELDDEGWRTDMAVRHPMWRLPATNLMASLPVGVIRNSAAAVAAMMVTLTIHTILKCRHARHKTAWSLWRTDGLGQQAYAHRESRNDRQHRDAGRHHRPCVCQHEHTYLCVRSGPSMLIILYDVAKVSSCGEGR
jgi:hypothetical protein